jgi:hypothetical protein
MKYDYLNLKNKDFQKKSLLNTDIFLGTLPKYERYTYESKGLPNNLSIIGSEAKKQYLIIDTPKNLFEDSI